jgi:hypothetical protein
MAERSVRRRVQADNCVAFEVSCTDWLPACESHSGPERTLHSEAGYTTATDSLCLYFIDPRKESIYASYAAYLNSKSEPLQPFFKQYKVYMARVPVRYMYMELTGHT